MEKNPGSHRQRKTWNATQVSRSFELYREKLFLQRLDVWPLLLLLLLCSVNTAYDLSSIAQQQAALQHKLAAAARARCVRTADFVLLIFHAPHTSKFTDAQFAGALPWQQNPLENDFATVNRRNEAKEQQQKRTPAAETGTFSEPERDNVERPNGREREEYEGTIGRESEEVKKEYLVGDTVKKQQTAEFGQEKGAVVKPKKKNRIEEENELFPVLSWLFSSLWFIYTLALLFCGGLLHLTTYWWVRMETLLGCSRVTSVVDATHVLVAPSCSRDVEPETLCKVVKLPTQIFFFYRKKKYLFDQQLRRFVALQFPKDLPLSDYFEWNGLATGTQVPHLHAGRKKKDPTTVATHSKRAIDIGGGRQRKTAIGTAVASVSGGEEYLSPYWKGVGGDRTVLANKQKYGRNEYDIPIPSFGDLFKEHAVAPFFVFQVFSISLWLLDEYWHYSVMMLVMLLFLECQMVKKRLKDFQQLRSMRMPPFSVSVYRDGTWTRAASDELLPGDIFALCSRSNASDAPLVCPVDALLLQGMVVANEATLTVSNVLCQYVRASLQKHNWKDDTALLPYSLLSRESVPQTKVALEREAVDKEEQGGGAGEERTGAEGEEKAEEESSRLDMRQRHKQHVVYAGTSVLLHANDQATFRNTKVPEKGCVAFVLRTAFSTSQGKLVRTILFSHGRVTVSSREAWYFLGVLLLLALGASAYVVYASFADAAHLRGRKKKMFSRFKLFLACSHIVMAVVPADLPITLSLAVTMSLIFLITKKIFCTEPFRLPYAGQVDICCFDKTGTLTSDSMRLHGVYGVDAETAPQQCSPEFTERHSSQRIKEGAILQGSRAALLLESPPSLTGDGEERRTASQERNHSDTAMRGNIQEKGERSGETEKSAAYKKEHMFKEPLEYTRVFAEHLNKTLERQALPFDTTAVMGCCHTLASVDGQLVGDPMEKAAFCSVGWRLLNPQTAVTTRFWPGSQEAQQDRLIILKRFPFTSELQRMFVVARHEGPAVPWYGASVAAGMNMQQNQVQDQCVATGKDGVTRSRIGAEKGSDSRKDRLLVAGKGSPEVMRTFLAEIPPFYDSLCRHFCLKGYRALTLAVKEYPCKEGTPGEHELLQQLRDRRHVEEGLTFAGVLVLTCPIKNHTKEDIYFIRAAGHRVVMITGDNPLTACQVAREVGVFLPLESQRQALVGCSAGRTLPVPEKQYVSSAACSGVGDKRRHKQEQTNGQASESEGTSRHDFPSEEECQRSPTFPHILILNTREASSAIANSDETGSTCLLAARATSLGDSTEKYPKAAAGDVGGERDGGTRLESQGRETTGNNSVASAPNGSSPSASRQLAQAGETPVRVTSSSASLRIAAVACQATAKNKPAKTGGPTPVGSLSPSPESLPHVFSWESPEGCILARAYAGDGVPSDIRGPSRVSGKVPHTSVLTAADPLSAGPFSEISSVSSSVPSTENSHVLPPSCIMSQPAACSSSAAFPVKHTPSVSHFSVETMPPGIPRWLAPVLSVEVLAQLAASYELCVTGAALNHLFAATGATTPQHQVRLLQDLVPFVDVYARMSPQHKELVLVTMNLCGHITLMCGDGTNDVGALKAAHVGVSLLCQKTTEKEEQNQKYDSITGKICGGPENKRKASGLGLLSKNRTIDRTMVLSGRPVADKPVHYSLARGQTCPAGYPQVLCPPRSERQTSSRAQQWQAYLEEALEQAEAADDPPLVGLGDASVASPFTFKGDSIHGVKTILRAGRATLVTVVMMYKLMALNSVVTAFSLSVLTLDGVKLGDFQTTLENLLCTVLTLLISKAQPTVENMSTFRPIASVFHPVVLLSLIGQAAVHCSTLYASWVLTRAARGADWDPDIDGPFEPNLVNTVVFLLIASMHASTFLSNYEGAPFMKPMRENRSFCMILGILLCCLLILVLEVFPDFNTWLSLVPFPSTACKLQVIHLVAVDILGSWAIGWSTRKLGCWCACNRSRLPRILR